AYYGMGPPTIEQYLTPRATWDASRRVTTAPKYFTIGDITDDQLVLDAEVAEGEQRRMERVEEEQLFNIE
ncbi:hypothetical protein BGZ65_012644, partial [Modicella reniformis]